MDASHRTSDRQSLLLTEAAIEVLQQQPALVAAALRTLDHWDQVAPQDSKPLRDEWRDILLRRQFERALATSDHGQQLRQAAPLARVIAPEVRLRIIRACKGRNSSI
jgi:hypothetical protein